MRRAVLISVLLLSVPAFGDGDGAKGKELFVTCAGCHSVTDDQRKMAPSLRTLFGKVTLRNGKHADDENVREIVLDGFNGMPSFRYSFRPAEIEDLMAYLNTLTGKPVTSEASQGEKYYRSFCLRCHNPDSRTAVGPDLRGRFQPDWLSKIDAGHAGSPPLREWLDGAARQSLADYLKTY